MDYINKLALIAKENECDYLINEPMSSHTSFKIGGKADILITVNDEFSLCKILNACKEYNINYFILGNGSNILVSDSGIRGAVIKLGGDFLNINILDDGVIECGCGVMLSKLCSYTYEKSLSGLEFAWGIPGTVGGAAFMNAGAYGGEMKDVLIGCEYINDSCQVCKLNSDEMDLSYRHSIFSDKNWVITKIFLKLSDGVKSDIKAKMDDLMGRRKDKQPLEYPSAGSVFKRPEGYFAGTLIEQCGLKGYTIGGAQVSVKHAGFIINIGGATCENVLDLVEHIKKVVFEATGVSLECEIRQIS